MKFQKLVVTHKLLDTRITIESLSNIVLVDEGMPHTQSMWYIGNTSAIVDEITESTEAFFKSQPRVFDEMILSPVMHTDLLMPALKMLQRGYIVVGMGYELGPYTREFALYRDLRVALLSHRRSEAAALRNLLRMPMSDKVKYFVEGNL